MNDVGFRRPPRATRFRPGVSGNPSGRPKRLPTFADELMDELRKLVPSGGERITQQRAIARKLIAAAIGGNLRAATVLAGFIVRTEHVDDEPDHSAPEDQAILQEFVEEEVKRRAETSGDDGAEK